MTIEMISRGDMRRCVSASCAGLGKAGHCPDGKRRLSPFPTGHALGREETGLAACSLNRQAEYTKSAPSDGSSVESSEEMRGGMASVQLAS